MDRLPNIPSDAFTIVQPTRPPAPYLGGKRFLSPRICRMIAEVPHRTFVDVCVGMGGIFLRRDRRAPVEVINDLSGDVANLFRILQRHYEAFMGELRWRLTTRADFDRLRAQDPSTLTDLERAARFLYLQRLAFGGKIEGRNFGVDRRTPGRFDVTRLEPLLADIHERLASVTVEQLDYAAVIRRYDGPETLFYIDPPYVGCEADYGDGFTPEDFGRMADQLAGIAGRFLLSINDTPLAREAFDRFHLLEVPVTYTVGTVHRRGGDRARELLVSGGAARPG